VCFDCFGIFKSNTYAEIALKQGASGEKSIEKKRKAAIEKFSELEATHPDARFHLLSTHAEASFAEAQFLPGDFLVFGKETAGLGQELLSRRSSDAIRIPMRKGLRSLNLSNSVAIVVYEGLRQNGYAGLV